MGLWYGAEIITHHESEAYETTYDSCVVVHLADINEVSWLSINDRHHRNRFDCCLPANNADSATWCELQPFDLCQCLQKEISLKNHFLHLLSHDKSQLHAPKPNPSTVAFNFVQLSGISLNWHRVPFTIGLSHFTPHPNLSSYTSCVCRRRSAIERLSLT